MTMKTKLSVGLGSLAIGVMLMGAIAFACVPSAHGARSCGTCGGVTSSIALNLSATASSPTAEGTVTGAPVGAGEWREGSERTAGAIALTVALGALGITLVAAGVTSLVNDIRRPTPAPSTVAP